MSRTFAGLRTYFTGLRGGPGLPYEGGPKYAGEAGPPQPMDFGDVKQDEFFDSGSGWNVPALPISWAYPGDLKHDETFDTGSEVWISNAVTPLVKPGSGFTLMTPGPSWTQYYGGWAGAFNNCTYSFVATYLGTPSGQAITVALNVTPPAESTAMSLSITDIGFPAVADGDSYDVVCTRTIDGTTSVALGFQIDFLSP